MKLLFYSLILPLCAQALTYSLQSIRYNFKSSSIKQILEIVKTNRGTNSLINEACEEVNNILQNKKIETAKEAMNAISVFKLASDLDSSISLLKTLMTDSSTSLLDTGIFNNIIDICAKQGNMSMTIYLLQCMDKLNIPKDKITFGTTLSACANRYYHYY